MSIGLKHSHYWKNQQLGASPGNYLGAQVFWFQMFGRGRSLNEIIAPVLMNALMRKEDEEEIIIGLF